MKLVLTGGGTGGHFYPLIAVAESLRLLSRDRHLLAPSVWYLAPEPYDENALFENEISFVRIPAAKITRYPSFSWLTFPFGVVAGFFAALAALYRIYPDAVFSKGGYASVPVVLAAAFLGIPVVIHESDAKPGRANILAARFAEKIAVSFPGAAARFPKKSQKKIAHIGSPIRRALRDISAEGIEELEGYEPNLPFVLILGGSLGARRLNETLLSGLGDMLEKVQVVHQTGAKNHTDVMAVSRIMLEKNPYAARYHPIAFLSPVFLARAAGRADVIVSRAGAGAISEIALWGKPAILIPIPEQIAHDQTQNAYEFAQTGAATVIEEANLTPHMLAAEIVRIATLPAEEKKAMGEKGKAVARPDAADAIADALLAISLRHEHDAPKRGKLK